MLTTVLFDMGGTLEDIWYNDETKALVVKRLAAGGPAGQRPGARLPGRCVLEADHGRRKGL